MIHLGSIGYFRDQMMHPWRTRDVTEKQYSRIRDRNRQSEDVVDDEVPDTRQLKGM